ncbi:MAG TPA: Mut7-C RNAse domain-containing protein [Vicinamibacteria bacterium]|nr:Mut7-C RNAse domain-containing protein [Vicinamibacteria bacterium]
MGQARFRFYEELNDFLPEERRKVEFACDVEGRRSVKDLIESLGVPHTEIEVILVNGVSVGFDHFVRDGDRVSVYPMFESLDVTPLLRLRERPLREPRFALDVSLGRLARYLRLCGFDSWYSNAAGDDELAALSASERRVLLTRDRELLKRRIVTHGYFVRSRRPREQLAEVCARLELGGLVQPFKRCIRCNGDLRRVEKASIVDRLEPETRRHFHDFHECAACRRIYWRGSHAARMEALVELARRAG